MMVLEMSKITKKYKFLRNLFWTFSFIANFGFIIGFFIYGMIEGTNKYSMCLVGLVGVILGVISLILKYHWRTPLIIVLGGLYFAIDRFYIVLISLALCIILDELIFTPAYKHFREKSSINVEIDKRIGD